MIDICLHYIFVRLLYTNKKLVCLFTKTLFIANFMVFLVFLISYLYKRLLFLDFIQKKKTQKEKISMKNQSKNKIFSTRLTQITDCLNYIDLKFRENLRLLIIFLSWRRLIFFLQA